MIINILFCIFCLLHVIDASETIYGVKSLGVKERNPVVRPIVDRFGLLGIIAIKVPVCLLVLWLINIMPNAQMALIV